MFDWRKEVRRYERILRREFQPECPVCNEKMRTGYLGGILIKWIQKGRKERQYVDPPLMPDKRFHRTIWSFSIMPTYECQKCGLIVAKYCLKHRGHEISLKEKVGKLTYCPYCNREMAGGRIYGMRGIWWFEKIGWLGFMRGRRMMVEPFPWLKIRGVATRRCNECGVMFSRYTPQTLNYFVKFILR